MSAPTEMKEEAFSFKAEKLTINNIKENQNRVLRWLLKDPKELELYVRSDSINFWQSIIKYTVNHTEILPDALSIPISDIPSLRGIFRYVWCISSNHRTISSPSTPRLLEEISSAILLSKLGLTVVKSKFPHHPAFCIEDVPKAYKIFQASKLLGIEKTLLLLKP